MPGVEAVDGHVDDGARQLAGQPVHILPLHQAAVAHAHGAAVHLGHDAVAGDLLHVSHPAGLHFLFAGLPQGHGNGMGGILLRQGGVFQHLVLGKARLGMDGGDGEGALCQGAGLVEHHGVRLGQLLQIVAALHQDAALGGAADAAEEAQGHGDHQCAGAGDDQEGQGAVEPFRPGGARQEGRGRGQHRQQNGGDQEQGQGGIHHAGGVVLGEAGDELLADRLFLAGIFHQFQDLRDRGFLAGLGNGDPQQPRQVHAAADDIVPRMDVPGQGLAGKGGGVQGRAALQNGAVQGHPLAGLHHDNGTHRYVLRVYLLQSAVRFQIGGVRPDVHEGGDGGPGLAHGVVLEQLAGLVEQHDEHGLVKIAGGVGAHRCQGHQEVLVEHLAVDNAQAGLPQHIVADDEIGHQAAHALDPAGEGQDFNEDQQRRGDEDAVAVLSLFFCQSCHHVPPFQGNAPPNGGAFFGFTSGAAHSPARSSWPW